VSANAEPARYVLDSFALFAHFEAEAGGPVVKAILTRAQQSEALVYLSIINLGEAVYITERERGLSAAERLIAAVDGLPIRVVEADRKHTFAAAHLKARLPIAYADAFALALAISLKATLVTGDSEFRSTGATVPILWLPRT
jgi:predicted nucleic acid-binding protein